MVRRSAVWYGTYGTCVRRSELSRSREEVEKMRSQLSEAMSQVSHGVGCWMLDVGVSVVVYSNAWCTELHKRSVS